MCWYCGYSLLVVSPKSWYKRWQADFLTATWWHQIVTFNMSCHQHSENILSHCEYYSLLRISTWDFRVTIWKLGVLLNKNVNSHWVKSDLKLTVCQKWGTLYIVNLSIKARGYSIFRYKSLIQLKNGWCKKNAINFHWLSWLMEKLLCITNLSCHHAFIPCIIPHIFTLVREYSFRTSFQISSIT